MPVMNGLDATRAIRAQEEAYYKTLPIIAMSANAYDEDIRASLDSGMNAHIAKPFQPDDLIKTLCRYIVDQ
jgi:CheY-like chemotaxis protein